MTSLSLSLSLFCAAGRGEGEGREDVFQPGKAAASLLITRDESREWCCLASLDSKLPWQCGYIQS